jgi:hypothetical protein
MVRPPSVLLVIGLVLGADAAGADTRSRTIAMRAGALRDSATPAGSDLGLAAAAQTATLLLKIGSLKTDPEFGRLTEALESASRQALGELPGIRLLADSEDADAAAAKRRPPVVLLTGKLVALGQKDEGEEILISAKVEYFLHRMPGQSIAAVVSGVATARVAPIQMKKKRLRERLERALVAAAVQSAAKRTAPALRAASD